MPTLLILRLLILGVWLLPCAWQDWKKREVSNWLTVPAFAAAWIYAGFAGLPLLFLTAVTFLVTYMAVQGQWMGAADGKAVVTIVAFAPAALLGVIVVHLLFLAFRWAHKQYYAPAPGLVIYAAGVALTALWVAIAPSIRI